MPSWKSREGLCMMTAIMEIITEIEDNNKPMGASAFVDQSYIHPSRRKRMSTDLDNVEGSWQSYVTKFQPT